MITGSAECEEAGIKTTGQLMPINIVSKTKHIFFPISIPPLNNFFKVFCPLFLFPTPSPGLLMEQFLRLEQIGKRKFIRIVESKIPKIAVLSILKKRL